MTAGDAGLGTGRTRRTGRPSLPPLRAWQESALARFYASNARDFLAVATPGAGKTAFALVAAQRALAAQQVRRIVVVTPTQHLKRQWAQAADGFGLALEPAWSSRSRVGERESLPTHLGRAPCSERLLPLFAFAAGATATPPAVDSPPSAEPAPLSLRERRDALREQNAARVREIVHRKRLSHLDVNVELNRRAGIRRVTEATLAQLEKRLAAAEAWLRRR